MSEKILGLEFEEIESGTPLSAIFVAKLLTDDARIMFAVRTTEDMNLVEIIGMLRYATLHYETQLIAAGEIND